MTANKLRDLIVAALDEGKGQDIQALDVSKLTSITDHMVMVSGTSNRHVKSLVDHALEAAKQAGEPARGVEGRENYEWVLADFGDVLLHVMQKEAREFYELERLWTEIPADSESTL